MLATERPPLTNDQLTDLERSVAVLDTRWQRIQWSLEQATAGSIMERFRSFVRFKPESRFMSTVCNRQVRLNTRLALHGSPRA